MHKRKKAYRSILFIFHSLGSAQWLQTSKKYFIWLNPQKLYLTLSALVSSRLFVYLKSMAPSMCANAVENLMGVQIHSETSAKISNGKKCTSHNKASSATAESSHLRGDGKNNFNRISRNWTRSNGTWKTSCRKDINTLDTQTCRWVDNFSKGNGRRHNGDNAKSKFTINPPREMAKDRSKEGGDKATNRNSNNPSVTQLEPSEIDCLESGINALKVTTYHSPTLVPKEIGKKRHQDAKTARRQMKMVEDFAKNLPSLCETKNMLSRHQRNINRQQGPSIKKLLVSHTTYNVPSDPTSAQDIIPSALGDSSCMARVNTNKISFGRSSILAPWKQSKTVYPKEILKKPQQSDPSKQRPSLTKPGRDIKFSITAPFDSSQRTEIAHRFDNFTANLVAFGRSRHSGSVREHRNWLGDCEKLSTTQQTSHVEVPTSKQLYREDCKKAFASARVLTVPRRPVVIAGSPQLHMGTGETQKHCRSCWDAKLKGTFRFHPWAGYGQAKVLSTICYFQNVAPAHLDPQLPARTLRDGYAQRRQESEKEETHQRSSGGGHIEFSRTSVMSPPSSRASSLTGNLQLSESPSWTRKKSIALSDRTSRSSGQHVSSWVEPGLQLKRGSSTTTPGKGSGEWSRLKLTTSSSKIDLLTSD